MKEKTIKLLELISIYEEVCGAIKPSVQYDLNNEEEMMRQAIFIKDKALNAVANFLYNKGITVKDLK